MEYPAAPTGYTLADSDITLGEAVVRGWRVLPAEGLGPADFQHFLEWLREVIPAELVLRLPPRLEPFGAVEDLGAMALADSVAGSAVMRLPDQGLLMSSRDTVEYLASYVADEEEVSPVEVSWRRQTDFTRFSHLWKPRHLHEHHFPYPEWRDVFTDRFPAANALGRAMGEFHDHGIIRVDAHVGNWTYDATSTPPLTCFDLANTRYVYPPVDPVACATDLVPLMTSFERTDWVFFQQGYLRQRPQAGRLVMAVIQLADLTGWSVAFHDGDHLTSLRRLDKALTPGTHTAERVRLLGVRALVLSRLGRHEEALAQYEDVLASDHGSGLEVVHRFNHGQALVRAGRPAAARAAFEWVHENAGDSPSQRSVAYSARMSLMELPPEDTATPMETDGAGPEGA